MQWLPPKPPCKGNFKTRPLVPWKIPSQPMGDTHLIKSTPYLMVVHKCIFKIRDGLQEAKTSFSFGQKQYLAGIRNCAENEKPKMKLGRN